MRGVRDSPAGSASVGCTPWAAATLAAGVEVSHVDLRPDPSLEAEAFDWLDGDERERWREYLPGPRRRFSLCRAALRSILCGRLGCRNEELSFGASDRGKPFAVVLGERSDARFNISHSGDHGLIAIAGAGRVGVDLEERISKRNLDGLIEAVAGPEERAELATVQGIDRLRLFYRIWTFKEALIKALGTGFSTDVSRFQVPPNLRRGERAGTFRFPHLPSVPWALEDIGGEDFAAALAYELPASPTAPGRLKVKT